MGNVENTPISASKANRLYWLGRYEERVYLTLHLLRRVYDKMIDGDRQDYETFWQKLDMSDSYGSTGEFTLGMMYDDKNPGSIMSSLNCAMDNAIMLREDIKSETMSYIEMSITLLKRFRNEAMTNVTNLQPVTDWALAFWGSAAQRTGSPKILSLMMIGQAVERIDIMLRFNYPFDRIARELYILQQWAGEWPELLDESITAQLEEILEAPSTDNEDEAMRWTLNRYINQLVRV